MKTQHTPGPWELVGNKLGDTILSLNPGYITLYKYRQMTEEQKANAKLIAAAPDLLAACRKALDYIHSLPYAPSIDPSTKAQDDLVDAIAKATEE